MIVDGFAEEWQPTNVVSKLLAAAERGVTSTTARPNQGKDSPMPQAVEQHSTNLPRRSRRAVGGSSRRRRPFSVPAALRARLELLIEQAIEALDALDGDPDAEPDFDGEEAHDGCCAAADDNPVSMPCRQNRNDFGAGTPEDAEPDVDEAWAQPPTLCPDRRAAVVYRPSAKQQRAAYRANGDAVPANLRGLLGRAFV